MRFLALACDYDGTLAADGRVAPAALHALGRLKESGRRLLLVTGRELPDLRRVFPELDRFDRVVAENGGLLYDPATRTETPLADPPPPALVQALRDRGVAPLSAGRTIIATWEPHQTAVLDAIREQGLEHHVVFNKGAVMVLPSGVNKATGLAAALHDLGLSPHNVVGVGDAENDHAFLAACECGVAVANALPMLKEAADLVTAGERGAGVAELAERLLDGDLADLEPALDRHHQLLGTRVPDGTELRVPPYGTTLLVAGPSGSGKSTLTTGLLERLAAGGYQFCLVDPEGDYEEFATAVPLGDTRRPPDVEEVVQFLADPGARPATVNLVGLGLDDRPGFFGRLLPRLAELRARTGRPHWIVADEAHHLLPAESGVSATVLPRDLGSVLLVTVHPERVSPQAVAAVTAVVAVGAAPGETLRAVAQAQGRPAPDADLSAGDGTAVLWRPPAAPQPFRVAPAASELRRHRRKYAEGDVGDDRSFYFRGPDGRLNLRARNLVQFLDLADGVDVPTWEHHLGNGDVERWFEDCIKDPELARHAREVAASGAGADETRRRIREAVEERYTLPA